MKKLIIAIFLAVLFYLLWASLLMTHPQPALQMGHDIHLNENQKQFLKSDFDEKQPLAFYFMASWCHTCHAEYQALKQFNKNDQQWVAVLYFDRYDDALQQYPDLHQTFDGYIVDSQGEFSLEWGVKGTPEILLFERGQLVKRALRVKALT